MEEVSEELIKKLVDLSDQLYGSMFSSFRRVEIISDDGFGAVQYLSFLLYPETENIVNREKFITAAIWYSIKQSLFLTKKESNSLIKQQSESFQELTYGRVEKTISKANRVLDKRFQAWQSYDLASSTGGPLAKTHIAVSKSYDRMFGKKYRLTSLENDIRSYRDNFRSKTFKPSRGVLHLTQGFLEAFCFKQPREYRRIEPAILDPFWVFDAVKISESCLKSRILDVYLRHKGINSGPKADFNLDEILVFTFNENTST